jgi:plastocyanin
MGLVPSRRGLLGVLALAALAALPAAASAATVQVTVGTFVKPINTDMDAFYPTRTSVRVGDTVRFVFAGFHTVTFPGGQRVARPEIPAGSQNPPTNDASGAPYWWGGTTRALRGNPRVFLPVGGRSYSGTQYLNSGIPQGPRFSYTVKFTKAGTFKFRCSIHPKMAGQVTVAPKNAAVPSAAELKRLGAAELAADRAAATAVVRVQRAKPSATRTITAGPGPARFTVTSFFPKRATVPAGSTVTFKLAGKNEFHTVSFGTPQIFQRIGPTFIGPPPVIAFGPLVVYPTDPPAAGPPAVTPTAHGDGYVGSGFLSDPGLPGPPHTFRVRFPTPGTYTYVCFLHEDMGGQIVVR